MASESKIYQVLLTCFLSVAIWFIAAASVAIASDSDQAPTFNSNEVALILTHGPWPTESPPDAGNELSGIEWAEQLGALLFLDTDLSSNGSLACISCHQPDKGFADATAVGLGAAQHVRNTQGLWNVALQRWFGWDGGADSLWAASLRPMLSPIEMNGKIPTIAKRLRQNLKVSKAFTGRYPTLENDDEALVVFAAKCIAAYMRTLISPTTSFDQYRQALANNDIAAQATYPASAKRGLKIFIGKANCLVCHYGPNFSNGEFHDIGRPFFTAVGKVDPGRFTGIERLRKDRYNLTGLYNTIQNIDETLKTSSVKLGQVNFGQWRTPSLRNLTLTAPYMHDGSIKTLDDVVDTYINIDLDRLHSKGESILKPLALTKQDKADLVNFLKSISP